MNSHSLNRRSEIPIWAAWMIAAVISAGAQPAIAQDQPPTQPKEADYVFKQIEIKPYPGGENYKGRFLFINKSAKPVMVFGFEEPINGMFEPQFPDFQILIEGKWSKIQVGYCGTGAEQFAMNPGKEYEFILGLNGFKEQNTPLTCKVGVDDFWSEPFVLDWKKDRSEGKFAKATAENFAKARTQFAKAGFKKHLLAGDDFCDRLFGAIMKETAAKDMAASFVPFADKLDATPGINLDGTIRIDFRNDEYTGWFSMDSRKLTPEWFREAIKKHVAVGKWGDGIQMELDDGTNFKAPLYLCINYVPSKKSKQPSKEDAEKMFRRMLGVLDAWLK